MSFPPGPIKDGTARQNCNSGSICAMRNVPTLASSIIVDECSSRLFREKGARRCKTKQAAAT
jgi:hypothetical protein